MPFKPCVRHDPNPRTVAGFMGKKALSEIYVRFAIKSAILTVCSLHEPFERLYLQNISAAVHGLLKKVDSKVRKVCRRVRNNCSRGSYPPCSMEHCFGGRRDTVQ